MATDGSPTPSKWTVLIAVGLAYFVILMTSMVSFLVLRDIAEEFDVMLRTVGWVVIIESLIAAAFLLPLGGLSDRLGRQRTLHAGVVVFGLGLVLTGLSSSFVFLIIARIITSIGNTLIQAVGTGILVAAFPPEERGLALGGQMTAIALGAGLGPLIGGVLLAVVSWKTLFLLLAIPTALTFAVVDRIKDDPSQVFKSEDKFDVRGALLASTLITIFVLTLNDPAGIGLGSPITIVSAVIVLVLLVAFVRVELAQPHPMLDLRFFKIGDFRRAVILRAVGFIGSSAITILIPFYLLGVRDASTQTTGGIMALFALGMLLGAEPAGRIYDRVGARIPMSIGLVIQIAILVALATVDAESSLAIVSVASLGNGIGQGLWNVPANSVLMGAIPQDQLGVGGAFSNVDRTVGSVTGQAGATAIVTGVMTANGFDVPLGDLAGMTNAVGSFIDGWQLTFFVAIVLTGLALVVALRTGSGAAVQEAPTN